MFWIIYVLSVSNGQPRSRRGSLVGEVAENWYIPWGLGFLAIEHGPVLPVRAVVGTSRLGIGSVEASCTRSLRCPALLLHAYDHPPCMQRFIVFRHGCLTEAYREGNWAPTLRPRLRWL